MQLLIPMSGQGERFRRAGYSEPKPLIPVNGTPMLERLLAVFPPGWDCVFVMADSHRETPLPETLRRLRPEGRQLFIADHRKGPGHAVRAALPELRAGEPVFVSYCDYGMSWDPVRFEAFARDSDCDACVVSYKGFHAHYLNPTPYAYSRMDGDRVVEVREKGWFTANRENEPASAGGYYFRTPEILRRALDAQDRERKLMNGESYISLTVQALIESEPSADVRVFEIPYFYQWGTPEDLRAYEFWERVYKAWNHRGRKTITVDQILMPMAGQGARFRSRTDLPKPLIPIEGQPMFRRAWESLPRASRDVFVALDSFAAEVERELPPDGQLIRLNEVLPGQALTTEAGLPGLGRGDLIVSSCDHAIVVSPELFTSFRERPDCDAAILVIRGFPGADRSPASFTYVETEGPAGGVFPLVRRVSVKEPLSATPSADPLLVGTFWFRDPEVLRRGIGLLKERGPRVNNELYLDSVFELLIADGLKVRAIPLEAYLNWGDPESLAEALYWSEVFTGRAVTARSRLPELGR